MRVGEISTFPAAAPLPHGGIVKGSGAQPTRKTTIGYSYPARGGEAEERSSLGLRSQVSTAAVWGPKTRGTQLLGGKAQETPLIKPQLKEVGSPTFPPCPPRASCWRKLTLPAPSAPYPARVSQAQPPASIEDAAHPPAGPRSPR